MDKEKRDKKQKEKFKEMIEEGKWNYVFKYGVGYFGGFMFLFWIFLEKFIYENKIDSFDIFVYIIIFGIGGLIFGLITWKSMNKKFKQK